MIKDERNDWIIGGKRLARVKKAYSFTQIPRQREKWQILLANNPRLLKKCSN